MTEAIHNRLNSVLDSADAVDGRGWLRSASILVFLQARARMLPKERNR